MKTNTQRESISALQLRCTAGCAPERRGSALLIVIGTLALVAVFAAVYVSIGRTDRRSSNALKERLDQGDTAVQIGEYLAGVVGDDRLDAFVQYDKDGNPFAAREVTDAPYTDWTRRTEATLGSANSEATLFTPTGGPFRMDGLVADTDYRVANDPWLASTKPTFLGNPGDPLTAGADERPFGSIVSPLPTNYPNATNYLDQRDWLQISNFAEDGRPVNLFNLRPNAGFDDDPRAGPFGGFESEPGIGTSPREDGRDIRRMSNYLSLLNVAEPGNPRSFLQAFDPAVDGVWVPGYNDPQVLPNLNGQDVYNTPAVWTMYQRFMHMPMNQPFAIFNREGDESSWADPDYPPYQYADANGNGFADSRWFELRSARDIDEGLNNLNSNQPREDIRQLLPDGDMRYFVAARAVDLSSMVNVNTATDGLATPTIEYPMGLTPAEVDLRRLLTMQDAAGDYTSVIQGNAAIPLSFDAIPRPYTTTANLAEPRIWYAPDRPNDFSRDERDYAFYQLSMRNTGDLRELDNDTPSLLIGRYAYDALRRARQLGGSLTNNYVGTDPLLSGPPTDITDLVQYPVQLGPSVIPPRTTAEERFNEYINIGTRFSANPGLANINGQLFGLDDLGELLTYHGLNDPDFTSRLERVMEGRFESQSNDTLQTRRLSPLLSNRDLALDRFNHSRILSANDMREAPSPQNQTDLRRIGEVSRNAMALMTLSPRTLLTTLSGHTPLSPDKRVANPNTGAPFDASEPMPLDGADVVPTLAAALGSPRVLFGMYAGALAGELEDLRGQSWVNDLNLVDDQDYSTLFYGHRGPELALRIAAHMSVNTRDLIDSDQIPSVATLMVDDNRRNNLDNTGNFPDDLNDAEPGNEWYRDYPGAASGQLLDPGEDLIADNDLDIRRQAVNVYGMEPMPVITEVATFHVFHDASELAGGDQDYLNLRPERRSSGLVGPIPDVGDLRRVTIDGTNDVVGNPDHLMQCIAFQLHNPWDEPISLGGDNLTTGDPLTRMRIHDDPLVIDAATNQYQFDYYIEWNGHFFKLAEFERFYPSDSSQLNRRPNDQNITGANNPATGGVPTSGGPLDPATFPDFVARNVVLQPGETRVFYAMSDHRIDPSTGTLLIDDKWADALDAYGFLPTEFVDLGAPDGNGIPINDQDEDGLPDGFDGRGWTGPAQEFARQQLAPQGTDPVLIHRMNPQTGEYLNANTQIDIFAPGDLSAFNQLQSAANRIDNTQVRLWRKIVTPAEEENDPQFVNRITENLVHNDLLVDRIRIESSGIAETLATGNQEIQGTVSFPENYPDTQGEIDARVRNDNTGYTIVRWASTRRRNPVLADYNSDNFDEDDAHIAQIREWMLSSQLFPGDAVIDAFDQYSQTPTIEDFRNVSLSSDPQTDFQVGYDATDQTDFEVASNLERIFLGQPVVVTANEPPFRKDQLDVRYPGNGPGSVSKFDNQVGSGVEWAHPDGITQLHTGDTAGSNTIEIPYDPDILRPQLPSGNSVNPERPRLGDLLLAMGIGPTFAPSTPGSLDSNLAEYHPEEWITFTEALAIALGYERPNASNDLASSVWADTWRPDTEREQRVLEEGRLALDRFVPFLNTNPSEDPNEFNPGADRIRRAGVPLALGVVDRARAIAPAPRATDPLGTGTNTLDLERATFGTININTAPVEVLRLLPGLTPSRAQFVNQSTTPENEWWGAEYTADRTDGGDTFIPDLQTATDFNTLLENPDVAAAIVAYRDRTYGMPNTAARPAAAGTGALSNAPFYLSPDPANLDTVAQNMIEEIPPTTLPGFGFNQSIDRSSMTGINGLRPTPGFGSLGELLAVRVDPNFVGDTTNSARWPTLRHLSIDQLGYDGRRQGIADGSTDPVTVLPEVFSNDRAGITVDDYAERLALANGVLNLISVRSDYYAVWFVVQGYRESDVANLRPEDPLIPSLHKRYLMVIDRSNVVEAGDKPKILLFREVPL